MSSRDGPSGLRRVVFVAEHETGAEHTDAAAICGFVALQLVAGVAEIESLGVSPLQRRKGIGRALCAEAIAWARSQGADVIELEVRATNGVATALYLEQGFVEQGRRRGYYHEPVEDAILMGRHL
ncbi:ribosomal-protein-alanine N-acetyltransferase [Bryocella elongata]|uniref:Ribosomal-protein-alanine N-acetyltransferase n=2 Tax=Bryocella elongata TaxID=863522 RepID=A0A1H5ZJN7_9BACT|nr:ribosomal-protein-alanine N-acetyltransferase [Bryocella elongata]